MKNRIGVLIFSLFFITNLNIGFYCTIHAQEPDIIWDCTIHINESGGKQDDVVFGEALDARDGSPADNYDVVKPPTPIPPYVKASFIDNLPAPYDFLWEDYRQYPDASKTWNLTIQWMPSSGSSSTTITLSWLIVEIDDSEYTSINLCTDTGTILTNMLIHDSYTFDCPAYVPQSFRIVCKRTNNPPGTPNIPIGETIGYHGTSYIYVTSAIDPDNNDVYYQFDWGDGIMASWLGPCPSGQSIQTTYIWNAPGTYHVKVHSKDIYNQQSIWSSTFSVEMQNRVPAQPANPSPQNGASNVQRSLNLTWSGTDPDGDIITYTMYFGTTNPPTKLVDNQSSSSFNPGTLHNQTTYYWKIISWDGFQGSTSSPLWSFTTRTDNSSSEPPNGQTNQHPVADASQSEQTGLVGSFLSFNGSRSYDLDGYLTKWSWEFGDGTNGTGERTIHAYQAIGSYTVTLMVIDDVGAIGTDTFSVEVGSTNRPPIKPVITGARTGAKNSTYAYTISAVDHDNDFLQYIVSWGDGTQNTSLYLPNGTSWSVSHSWGTPGKYQIIVEATDNNTFSEQTIKDVFIDVFFINTIGFLFDTDNDGWFDSLYINDTRVITDVERLSNGSYLLDTDNDGKWNYQYDPSTGSLTSVSTTIVTIENQWFFILIIAIAILIIACIVYLYKKNYF